MENKDYYAVLGVEKTAGVGQIREAYRKLAFAYHPDRNKDDPAAAEKMKTVNEAYAVLSDSEKRRGYDRMTERFGDRAHQRFRQQYSQQDIFSGSDIQQVFEEMARSFGIRGFNEIFKDFEGAGHRRFEFRQPGVSGRGFVFFGGFGRLGGKPGIGALSKIGRLLMEKAGFDLLPQRGKDLNDVIVLSEKHAALGGPYAYAHKKLTKKLVVQIPEGVRQGQKIRLAGMGKTGSGGGAPGDLFLTVHIRRPLMSRLKRLIK